MIRPWRIVASVAGAAVAVVAVGVGAHASCTLDQTDILIASDFDQGDFFGFAVSMDGSRALIGAPHDDDRGLRAGAAYVFQLDGGSWVEHVRLEAPDADGDEEFGAALAISGAVAVIAAPREDDGAPDAGAVYVYREIDGTWAFETKLTAPDPGEQNAYGTAVALDGEVLVVGVPGDDESGPNAGAAFVYRHDGEIWQREAKLTASDGWRFDDFGVSVAVDANVIVVGASGDDLDTGAAYVYRYYSDAWWESKKLTASDAADFDAFGTAVAVEGELIVVGAIGEDEHGAGAGAVYAYRLDLGDWREEEKIIPPGTVSGDGVGRALAIDGGRVLVGVHLDDVQGEDDAGTAYVYHRIDDAWEVQLTLVSSVLDAYDEMGRSVALSGDWALAGAHRDDLGERSAVGTARVFDVMIVDCNDNGQHDLCDLDAGLSPDCNANEVPDECDLAFGTSEDCNVNAVPDECDFAPAERAELAAADGAQGHQLGTDVSIDGRVALAGAIGASSAYVYRRDEDGWHEEARLRAADHDPFVWFGQAVAIQDDRALVGAYGVDDVCPGDPNCNSGAAYVFETVDGTWTQAAKLAPDDLAYRDFFGGGVAIDGDVAVVGASSHDAGGDDAGTAYVYRRSGGVWTQSAKLLPNDLVAGDRFGDAVGVHGDLVVIGATQPLTGTGAVYVYRDGGGTWMLETRLTAPNPRFDDEFGRDVAVQHDVLVVGTEREKVHVFRRSDGVWTQEAVLRPRSGQGSYGRTLGLDTDRIIVGAFDDDDVHEVSGAAYVYRHEPDVFPPWVEAAKLKAAAPRPWDRFGSAVAVSGRTYFIGASHRDLVAPDSGAAFVFVPVSLDEDGDGIPDECACDADLDGSGAVDFGDLLVILSAWGPCPPAEECPEDVDGDRDVGFGDIVTVLAQWGPCP